jgi:uncharacterized protein (DUF1015 family)
VSKIYPFKAVRAPFEQAEDVASPPYDVMSEAEARVMVDGKPLSMLRVTRPEVELPASMDPHDAAVYETARGNYRRLKAEVPLIQDTPAGLYVYSLEMNGHRQTGIACCADVDEYDRDLIRKHEKTRRDKEDDRTRHILTVGAQTGPVFLTYRDQAAIGDLVDFVMESEPIADFRADDGVQHTVWRAAAPLMARLIEEFTAIPVMYIADGHHRAASASRVRAECRRQNPNHTGNEEYNRFVAVAFPAGQLRILPYNRVVRDLNGHTPESFLTALRAIVEVTPAAAPAPAASGSVHLYLDHKWWALRFPEAPADLSPALRLDVSRLQDLILEPLLAIADPRTDKRIDFVGGIRGTAELEKRVDSGRDALAFSMFATTVDELMAISDAGQIMPPKSTWFEPKLRDGLLVHELS